ncbi:HAD hydrolase-like protein [Halorussus aquaticus]
MLGKPGRTAAEAVESRVAGRGPECLVVGDRLDTDIALGDRAGLTTALVLSGVSTRADAERSDVTPDHVLDSVADVESLL